MYILDKAGIFKLKIMYFILMDKLLTLEESIKRGVEKEHYFLSEVPFSGAAQDFMLYRIPETQLSSRGDAWMWVLPSKYDPEKREYIDLIPVEVFRDQHMRDPIHLPPSLSNRSNQAGS